MSDMIRQPAWRKIVAKCRDKICLKHKKYGNSWVTTTSYRYWVDRLQGEVNELRLALEKNTDKQSQQECIDIINICAMIYTVIEDHHYPSDGGPPKNITWNGILKEINELESRKWRGS